MLLGAASDMSMLLALKLLTPLALLPKMMAPVLCLRCLLTVRHTGDASIAGSTRATFKTRRRNL